MDFGMIVFINISEEETMGKIDRDAIENEVSYKCY